MILIYQFYVCVIIYSSYDCDNERKGVSEILLGVYCFVMQSVQCKCEFLIYFV